MKKKNIFYLVLGLLFIVLSGCTLASSEDSSSKSVSSESLATGDTNVDKTEIVVGTGGTPAPYVTVGEDGQPTGYDIEVIKEVFNRLPDHELRIELTDIPSVLTGVSTGTYDIAVNNFSYNEERANNYYYSYPYNHGTYIYIHSKNTSISSLDEAAENGLTYVGTVGTAATTAIENYNADHPNQPIEIEYSEAELPVLIQSLEERDDAFKIDDYPIYYLADQQFDFDQLETTDITEADADYINYVTHAYLLFGNSAEGEELRELINPVLKEMAEDGTIQRLSEEHFGRDQTPEASNYEETVN